jgi:hypothetical protein
VQAARAESSPITRPSFQRTLRHRRQEIYRYLLTHHAISALICQAATEAGTGPDRVNSCTSASSGGGPLTRPSPRECDLQHRPGDRHSWHGREDQRHRRRDRKHGDEVVEVHRGYFPRGVMTAPS